MGFRGINSFVQDAHFYARAHLFFDSLVHFVVSKMKWQQSMLSFLCSDKNKRSRRQTGNNAIKSNYFYMHLSVFKARRK